MDTPNLLRPQDVLPRVESQGRRTLLRYVACRLSTRPGLPEDAVHAVLASRESLGSTALGHGIAIPHALMAELLHPAAVLAILQRPICFEALDDQLVDVALAVIWPRKHAAEFTVVLSRFCRSLMRGAVLEGIRNATSADGVLESLRSSDGFVDRRGSAILGLPKRPPAETRKCPR
ncbi:PTS sugar transporter subunit IIA [Mesorhizobium sp. WSM4976]|uniref:PTS sugar transporter subunit IIA n=1 Tax=Mesorhizobium sp. WSM4976 TaxID=3038549 RepID=UPI002417601B|nr:PTS sugar transporter subunit IIA [Mesorhizobium sp. WSM4976]MDG4892568.1 PTS sugar transporter subunit IIA [Mesorhizobium sp. WSM4976]